MSRMTVALAALLAAFPILVSATTINIPSDYPTIQQGINASADGDTVLVQPGTYVENINFNGHNIVLGSLFLTTGNRQFISNTIIDGNNNGVVVSILNGEDHNSILTGFTVKNGDIGIKCDGSDPIIASNNVIENVSIGSVGAGGGGIICFNSDAKIISNLINWNGAVANGFEGEATAHGILCDASSNLTVLNNVIANTYASAYGSTFACGFECNNSTAILINNIIIFTTVVPVFGEAIGVLSLGDEMTIVNNIIRFNQSYEIQPPYTVASYCNIGGGWPGEGNIDADPLFISDYRLGSVDCGYLDDSPCIDAGDPAILDSLLDCSWGLGGPRSDMGAYGGGDSLMTSIFDNMPSIPAKFMLLQNYPNPFNVRTTIRFVLPEPQEVELAVYDLLGRRNEILIDEYLEAGSHNIEFDASSLSSGVYFYRLRAAEVVETKRMVLMK